MHYSVGEKKTIVKLKVTENLLAKDLEGAARQWKLNHIQYTVCIRYIYAEDVLLLVKKNSLHLI